MPLIQCFQSFLKAEHVGFDHHISLPCERVAVFRRQLANLAPADNRPGPEREDLMWDVPIKLFFAANDMNPHHRVALHIIG